jgi:hypothetical protein
MLDQPGIREATTDLWATFLEPACGNGNFLLAVLGRKLAAFHQASPASRQETFEFSVIAALTTIHGIDISRENVLEARARMLEAVREFYFTRRGTLAPSETFFLSAEAVLDKTIVWGNALEGQNTVELTEFEPETNARGKHTRRFRTRKHTLASLIAESGGQQLEMFNTTPTFPVTRPTHFLSLGTLALVEEHA